MSKAVTSLSPETGTGSCLPWTLMRVLLLQSGPFLSWGSLFPRQHICYLNSASAGGKLLCQELSGLGASMLSISGIKTLDKKIKLSCYLKTSCKNSTCGMKL